MLPTRLDVLVALLRQLDAEWPAQLDVADLPYWRRLELLAMAGRLRERLGELEAALSLS